MKKLFLFMAASLILLNAFAAKKPSLKDAVMAYNPELTKKAFDDGADPNEKWSGATALFWASVQGQTEVIKIIIAKGAKVDETGLLGDTPLDGIVFFAKSPEEFVAENKKTNEKILKHFTEEKAKESGWWKETDITKFSTVAERAKLLLDAGADPNFLLGNVGKTGTPFLNAVEKQNLEAVKAMLDSKKVDVELRLGQRSNKDNEWLKVYFASNTIDMNLVPSVNTPLMFAVEKQNLALVKILVEGGASTENIKKVSGSNGRLESALSIALDKGYKEIADYLISKGATSPKEKK